MSKYPKSKSGKQCIGPCYEAKTIAVHPYTLDYIVNFKEPFCPIPISNRIDPKTGKNRILLYDACHFPTKNEDISQKDLEMNMLIPSIDFNCKQFIQLYYDIGSYNDLLVFLNKNEPIYTKLRIIECSFNVFPNDIFDVIDDSIVNFYSSIIKKIWIRDMISAFSKYIYIDGKNIYLKENNDELNKNNVVIKVNYFIENFATSSIIYELLDRYYKKNKNKWNNIKLHNDELKKEYKNYIMEKIKNSL